MKAKMLECYKAYKNGNISLATCRNRIIELVFKNPLYFQIGRLQSDLKSNLILLLYDSLDSVLKKYNEQYGSFVTYLAATINGLKIRCFRDFYRQSVNEITTYEYYRNSYLEDEDPVYNNSYISSLSEIDYLPSKKEQKIYHYSTTNNQKEKKYNRLFGYQKILIIVLKASYFLDHKMIEKIAPYTRLKATELEDMCLELYKSLEPRRIKYESQKQIINHEFVLKNRCYNELKYCTTGTFNYENKLKAQKFHTKRWKNMLTKKQNPSYLCPTNREIADILHISEDQVHYILHKYGKNKDSQKLLKIVLSEYDYLSSNRKPT